MKRFRRIVLILLTCTLLFGLISCKKNKEDDDTSEPVPEISFLDYAVIRSEKSSVKLLDEISVLYGKLMSASGKANAYESDYLANGTEPDTEAKEILIGAYRDENTAEKIITPAENIIIESTNDGSNPHTASGNMLSDQQGIYLRKGGTVEMYAKNIEINAYNKDPNIVAIAVTGGSNTETKDDISTLTGSNLLIESMILS